MTLDKSTLVRSTRIRLCKPRRTIGARALAKSPSTNRAYHFERSAPTLLPTFAPAKVSAHAVEKSLCAFCHFLQQQSFVFQHLVDSFGKNTAG